MGNSNSRHYSWRNSQLRISWISRESDVLIRVESPLDGEFLVLTQLQLRYNSKMPRRMRAYASLAEEKYN